MGILENLKERHNTITDNKISAEKTKSSGPQLSQWTTFGNHIYRREGEVAAVEFVNEEYGIRKWIVDNNGYIQNYPGLENPEEWMYACLGIKTRIGQSDSFPHGLWADGEQYHPDGVGNTAGWLLLGR